MVDRDAPARRDRDDPQGHAEHEMDRPEPPIHYRQGDMSLRPGRQKPVSSALVLTWLVGARILAVLVFWAWI